MGVMLLSLTLLALAIRASAQYCPANGCEPCTWRPTATGPCMPKVPTCEQYPCPCQNMGTCKCIWSGLGTLEKYRCLCAQGYSGIHCENYDTVITGDPCFSRPCLHGGICSAVSYGYTCYCFPHYTGPRCETIYNGNPCYSSPCMHGGYCYPEWVSANTAYRFRCICTPYYSGDRCEILNNNPCGLNPCNTGHCTAIGTSYYCTCPSSYTGTNCETVVSTCVPNPCHNSGTCKPSLYGYSCDCPCFFAGTHCELHPMGLNNINPCQSSPCWNGGTCRCDGFEFKCECTSMFSGLTCQLSMGTCTCALCQQNRGQCFMGYLPCYCPLGYTGVCCEISITPVGCYNVNCGSGTCREISASPGWKCDCPCWVTGDHCEIPPLSMPPTNPCITNPCPPWQRCRCIDALQHQCYD